MIQGLYIKESVKESVFRFEDECEEKAGHMTQSLLIRESWVLRV